ncbi:MAG: hypothetical protein J5I93_26725 [Pirellulaceae bacterium]|nr:hypothetical protein [Pirellulaceae bacterium]
MLRLRDAQDEPRLGSKDTQGTLVAGDDQRTAQRIRHLLIRSGLECPEPNVVGLDLAVDRASRFPPELAVVALAGDPRSGLATISELEKISQAFLIALGPASDPQLILRALQGGADVYLDESRLDTELAEAVVRFKNRQIKRREVQQSGHVTVVLGSSGGSGTSLVAINLAAGLARQHGRVCLVDLCLTTGDLASLLDVHPTYTLADLCENVGRLDSTMFAQFLVPHEAAIHLLAAPRNPHESRLVTAKGVGQALVHARRQFPQTIVDLDNSVGREQLEALRQATSILLLVRLDYTSIRNTRLTLENLKEAGVGLARVRLVVNRFGQSHQVRISEAEKALGMKVSHVLPDDPARINRSVNNGVPVVLQHPGARISRRLVQLAGALATSQPDPNPAAQASA